MSCARPDASVNASRRVMPGVMLLSLSSLEMSSELSFDERLWFTMGSHCSGRHYLLGNSHTFNGRMLAWCPYKQKSFYVSKLEIDESSVKTQYWVKGFLAGNEPEPPVDETGDALAPDSPQYQRWVATTKLFAETGYWCLGQRQCESCGEELLPSWADEICAKCKEMSSAGGAA
jgi:hypothetical protein